MRKVILITLGLLLFQPFYGQEKIGGVSPAKSISVGGETLKLNGAGVRTKFFMDMYVASLYLKDKSNDRDKIINNDENMAITLDIVSSLITSKKMIDAVNEGFQNSTNGHTATLKKEIETFKSYFEEEIQKGDRYIIAYQKGVGVIVSKNGKRLPTIKGLAFKKALFGIWFSKKPADSDLMKGMLGG